jgi:hypothetical protein
MAMELSTKKVAVNFVYSPGDFMLENFESLVSLGTSENSIFMTAQEICMDEREIVK